MNTALQIFAYLAVLYVFIGIVLLVADIIQCIYDFKYGDKDEEYYRQTKRLKVEIDRLFYELEIRNVGKFGTSIIFTFATIVTIGDWILTWPFEKKLED